ncbi:fanconi anemia group j protein [Anaeramoeba flamelloides]|uniref:Fanconi anemia group j protein n=1 Tax=Anaeramoeba flamelloides TaxID=1746091 RepID=A0AAV7YMF3_9EUKA|nr:fanconi anemia group j protein [Anaeramoeba flamelloides]KAJ6255041.1 fanconi anemia group j protein [Anaeramoeba flamelloides]
MSRYKMKNSVTIMVNKNKKKRYQNTILQLIPFYSDVLVDENLTEESLLNPNGIQLINILNVLLPTKNIDAVKCNFLQKQQIENLKLFQTILTNQLEYPKQNHFDISSLISSSNIAIQALVNALVFIKRIFETKGSMRDDSEKARKILIMKQDRVRVLGAIKKVSGSVYKNKFYDEDEGRFLDEQRAIEEEKQRKKEEQKKKEEELRLKELELKRKERELQRKRKSQEKKRKNNQKKLEEKERRRLLKKQKMKEEELARIEHEQKIREADQRRKEKELKKKQRQQKWSKELERKAEELKKKEKELLNKKLLLDQMDQELEDEKFRKQLQLENEKKLQLERELKEREEMLQKRSEEINKKRKLLEKQELEYQKKLQKERVKKQQLLTLEQLRKDIANVNVDFNDFILGSKKKRKSQKQYQTGKFGPRSQTFILSEVPFEEDEINPNSKNKKRKRKRKRRKILMTKVVNYESDEDEQWLQAEELLNN